jgi:HPt (histidine-containing phosphotransfer) domain-containing protein
MTTDQRSASEQLHALRERFAAGLRARVSELEALVRAAREGATSAAIAPALVAAHRLAGTAGSYGHPAVGEAAAALEAALQRIVEHGAGAAGADAAAWEEAAAALGRAHAAAASATTPSPGSGPGLG